MSAFLRAALAAGLVAFAAACGGTTLTGSDGGHDPDAGQTSDAGQDACNRAAPSAITGAPQTVAKHATVTLEGAAAGTHGSVAYAWRFEALPPGSAAVLSSATAARPTFTADIAGAYVAALIVTDACGASTPANTVVTVANRAPVASAGGDRHVLPGESVTLDGSASSDADQDELTFLWSLVARPAGSTATLSSVVAKTPTFTPDAYGTYIAILTVSDGWTNSAPAAVAIQAGVTGPSGNCAPAAAPVANAGRDQTVSYASYVSLDGSGSSTGRGAPLTYKWTMTSAPAGSNPIFDSASAVRPNFQTSRSGLYIATLIVNDGCVDSPPSTVKITRLNNVPGAGIYYPGNQSPVPVLVPLTFQSSAYDADGDPLTYQWSLVSAPAGSAARIADPTVVNLPFTPDLPGSYVVSLVVSDGIAQSNLATISLTAASLPPTAVAGPDSVAGVVGTSLTLDGSGSTDPSRRALTYAWTLQPPAGSSATLTGASTARPSFVPDVTGIYGVQLVVSVAGASAMATTFVAVWPTIARLSHRILDAQYSSSLERIVMVAADPNALYLLDPVTHAEAAISLSGTPAGLSLSADGKTAVVGQLNKVAYVDLVSKTVAKEVPVVGDVGKVLLSDDGANLYVFPRGPQTDHIRLLQQPAAGGAATTVTSAITGRASARVRSGAKALYVTSDSQYSYPASIEKYALDGATPAIVASGSTSTCGDLWLSQAGTRLFTRCATLLRASSSSAEDLAPIGTLVRTANVSLLLRHLSDSTAAGEISAVASVDNSYYNGGGDDRTLRRWDANGLAARESVRFPFEVVGGQPVQWFGRYVFYKSDGSERYVLLQLDPTAGALQDFGVVTF